MLLAHTFLNIAREGLGADVAEDAFGAAKDGSDLAQNGSVKALIIKALNFPIAKARAKPLRCCTTRAKPYLRLFDLEVGDLGPSPRTRKAGPERTLLDPRERFLYRRAKRPLNV